VFDGLISPPAHRKTLVSDLTARRLGSYGVIGGWVRDPPAWRVSVFLGGYQSAGLLIMPWASCMALGNWHARTADSRSCIFAHRVGLVSRHVGRMVDAPRSGRGPTRTKPPVSRAS
jgi:hypothetical protein